jgi:hypothetical protein
MIATTISSSISEKPFCCFRISIFPRFGFLSSSDLMFAPHRQSL